MMVTLIQERNAYPHFLTPAELESQTALNLIQAPVTGRVRELAEGKGCFVGSLIGTGLGALFGACASSALLIAGPICWSLANQNGNPSLLLAGKVITWVGVGTFGSTTLIGTIVGATAGALNN